MFTHAFAHPGDPVERHLRLHLPGVEQGGRLVAVEVAPLVIINITIIIMILILVLHLIIHLS